MLKPSATKLDQNAILKSSVEAYMKTGGLIAKHSVGVASNLKRTKYLPHHLSNKAKEL